MYIKCQICGKVFAVGVFWSVCHCPVCGQVHERLCDDCWSYVGPLAGPSSPAGGWLTDEERFLEMQVSAQYRGC